MSLLAVMIFAFSVYLVGCVNYDQKTTLKEDGSGSMKIHYWSSMKNFSMGTTLGKFDFDEAKAKEKYKSSNSDVTSIKVEDKLDDSTKHVYMDIKFKDLNQLPSAKGFEKTKASWKEGKEGKDFMFTLLQDTSNAKTMGSSDYKLTYTFDFPGEVLSTNGRKDGKSVVWEKTLADLKTDVEMKATVKDEGKKCGLFGFEMPVIFALGMTFIAGVKRFKK